ncbi:MAG TPA: SRPBCC family protein [Anaerolineales bacterium]|nr:SRPBCC family protein [Anaerolineales bacterium]
MITFEQVGEIDAPVERVFAYISDISKIPEWRTDIPRVSNLNGPARVGSTFLEEVNFMGKKQLLMKVVELIPNQKLVIEAQSGMALLPTQSFTFVPKGSRTKVQLQVTMRTSGLFRLMEPMLAGQLKKIWAKYFENVAHNLSR